MAVEDVRKERLRTEIKKELKKHLADASQREFLMLTGLAKHFCAVHDLKPEEVVLVRIERGQETHLSFRKKEKESSLVLPKGIHE
jgi:hypothetical protein